MPGRGYTNTELTIGLIEELSIPEPNSGCWLWLGYANKKGYPRVGYGGKKHMVHRLAWELFNRKKIPDGMFACHRCDVPCCVNPQHIFVGTPPRTKPSHRLRLQKHG